MVRCKTKDGGENGMNWDDIFKTVRQNDDMEDRGKTCALCGKPYGKFGNNGRPLIDGRVCDDCNKFVVLYRLKLVRDKEKATKMPKMRGAQFGGKPDDRASPEFFDSSWQNKLREKER